MDQESQGSRLAQLPLGVLLWWRAGSDFQIHLNITKRHAFRVELWWVRKLRFVGSIRHFARRGGFLWQRMDGRSGTLWRIGSLRAFSFSGCVRTAFSAGRVRGLRRGRMRIAVRCRVPRDAPRPAVAVCWGRGSSGGGRLFCDAVDRFMGWHGWVGFHCSPCATRDFLITRRGNRGGTLTGGV